MPKLKWRIELNCQGGCGRRLLWNGGPKPEVCIYCLPARQYPPIQATYETWQMWLSRKEAESLERAEAREAFIQNWSENN